MEKESRDSTQKTLSVPLILTLVRLIFSPAALPFLLVYGLPLGSVWVHGILAFLFAALSLTDFFDGYLARKFDQETVLGRLLDPVADKFLLYASLVALVAADRIFFFWAIVLIGREFFVMAVRNVALEHGIPLHVSWLAKVKTAVQMIYITFVIANPYYQAPLTDALWWYVVEWTLLCCTLVLSLTSASSYYTLLAARLYTHDFKEASDTDVRHDDQESDL